MILNDFISSKEVIALLLYAGPDQILPIVSILGTIIGILLIWWRRFVMLARKGWMRLFKRAPSVTKTGKE
jgi:hypothetical protein